MLSGIILGSHSWCVFWVRKSSSNWSFYRQASALKSNLLVYLVTDIFILVFHKKSLKYFVNSCYNRKKKYHVLWFVLCVWQHCNTLIRKSRYLSEQCHLVIHLKCWHKIYWLACTLTTWTKKSIWKEFHKQLLTCLVLSVLINPRK